jgi:hypothetical protein
VVHPDHPLYKPDSTARCTAIRTLLEIKPPPFTSEAWAELEELAPRRDGRNA